jgi:chromate transporter
MSEPTTISLGAAARVWASIGFLSFGGPAGQIALMHRELVEKRKWIDEARFLHALNYCMLLPGPEAQQLATYIGWLLHRRLGGLIAGGLFVVPGFIAMLALSMTYVQFGDISWVAGVFFGLRAAVLALVVEAIVRISKRALKHRFQIAIACTAFAALFVFDIPFPFVVVVAAAMGFAATRFRPHWLPMPSPLQSSAASATVVDAMALRGELEHTKPSLRRATLAITLGLSCWAAPFVVVATTLGTDNVFFQQATFFSKTAIVTFGGAYAVLSYIAQRAVALHWLGPKEMLVGLGLAETTPGPLIMVVQFIAYVGAYRNPSGLHPVVAGVIGSVITVWVTFVPCFLWIFLGAPYIEKLRDNRALHGAMSCITAAVVGVIANLAVWFGMATMFNVISVHSIGPAHLLIPDFASVHWPALAITVTALFTTFRFHLGTIKMLAMCAALGVAWQLATG